MSRAQAVDQYQQAMRRGQKYYHTCLSQGKYPYPQVLDEIFDESQAAARVNMGTMEIPMDLVVGTLAAGRKSAFAGNFMPLLPLSTEFGQKWVNLCESHLDEGGIRDPITCYEYLGRFYVQEGNKRVSVLRSFEADTVRAKVTRVIPAWSDDPAIRSYYEFMEFYKKAGIYHISFRHPGCYARFQAAMGFYESHVWTEDERLELMPLIWRFREACTEEILSVVRDHAFSEVMLACMELYGYEPLKSMDTNQIRAHIRAILPDLKFTAGDEPVEVSMDPEIPEKTFMNRLLGGIGRSQLNVAFVHLNAPQVSVWTKGHDLGRMHLEETLGDVVKVRTYIIEGGMQADEVMETAVKDGAQILFATAPTLLGPARKVAALHPSLKVLVCALSVPFAGVRTYYSRIYETKFIAGAIAGAMSEGKDIGYIARYPILGVPAAINAFALGARMTAPGARILLDWTCLEGDPFERLMDRGVSIISGHPIPVLSGGDSRMRWGTNRRLQDGTFQPLTSDVWDWGKLYEQIVEGVLNGAWETIDQARTASVNYWWGLSSGVIDIRFSQELPYGVMQLGELLKDNLTSGALQPFLTRVSDQQGNLRLDGSRWVSPEELMKMSWLCENVEGAIPGVNDILEMARETTRLLALPEKDEFPGLEETQETEEDTESPEDDDAGDETDEEEDVPINT